MDSTLAIDAAIDSVEQKLRGLEAFAIKHRLNNAALPPISQRSFKNPRALTNAMESSIVGIENLAAALPRVISMGRSHIQAKLIDYDPGELFKKQLTKPLANLKRAADDISKLSNEYGPAAATVHEQVTLFEASIIAEAKLVSRASKMAKPTDPTALRKECRELVDASSDAADLKHDINVRSPLRNHAMALGDASAALGWVVAPAPLKHVREYKNIVNTLAEDILSRYIDLGCNPIHSDFAEALNAIVEVLVTYVEKEHPAGLRWNYAQGATPLGYRRAQRNLRKDAHPVGDFYRLMHASLTEFVLVSRELGGRLKTASQYLLGAYEEMAKAIETASGRVKPPGDLTAHLKMLLISVQHELTPMLTLLDKSDAEDKFSLHCSALREFIHSMQWATATIQKMSPVGYIIDIENVTLLYLGKVEKEFCKDEGYIFCLHRAWVKSVRGMFSDLKDYVKAHHPNELMFDTRRTRQSFEGMEDAMTLTKQLSELRKKSKVKKWKKVEQLKKTAGGVRKMFPTWCKSE